MKTLRQVKATRVPSVGLFVWQAEDTRNWLVSADLGNVRSYVSCPYKTEEEAIAELQRVAPMYPGLAWYKVTR
jgi:hypothetical protein